MARLVMILLAGSVALGYFVIAGAVAPKIKIPAAGRRCVAFVRVAAIAFFIGCGLTHLHILVHTFGSGPAHPVEMHEVLFHAAQAVGAWVFIVGAILRFELQIVPAQTRRDLVTEVEVHRRLLRVAEKIAGRDELTGLARRWRFDEALAGQIVHAETGRPSALIFIDLDGMKGVNDVAGHLAGDHILEHAGAEMLCMLRSTDTASRLGGDEFAIILADVGMDEAEAIAQRLVLSLRTPEAAGVPQTSASISVVAIDGTTSALELVASADVALYEAKRAGGDRCVRVEAPVP